MWSLLLVEDDDDFAAALTALLVGDGRFEIAGRARTGSEAVELAQRLRVDVVLMDLLLPGMDGVEATRRIHSRLPSARVIAISGSDYSELALEARLAGAYDYVRKDRFGEDLVEAILGGLVTEPPVRSTRRALRRLPEKDGVLRIATLNLWGRFGDWPYRRELLGSRLPPLEVDVYLLQEVVCGDGRGDQLTELAQLLGYGWTARVIAENRPHETEDEGVAILSRLPLSSTAVWPLPPSHPPRHRLEASVRCAGADVRLFTLHAAVSAADGRDEQIAALAELRAEPAVLGSDLNAPPALVEPLLGGTFTDTLAWETAPTWPVDADEFVRAWEDKLGEKPDGAVEARRLDYLLCRGLEVRASGALALRGPAGSGSDHRLVWADLAVGAPGRKRPSWRRGFRPGSRDRS